MLCLSLAASLSLFSLFASPAPSRSSFFLSLFPYLGLGCLSIDRRISLVRQGRSRTPPPRMDHEARPFTVPSSEKAPSV